MAGSATIKEVERSGTMINKDKLIELIKKSNQQTFTFSQNHNSKTAVIIVNI